MEYQKTEAVFYHESLKNGKMKSFDFLKVPESMKIRKIAFDQSEHSSVNCNWKKGINVPKSFVDGS